MYADVRAIAATDPPRAAATFRASAIACSVTTSTVPFLPPVASGWRGASCILRPCVAGSPDVLKPIASRDTLEIPLAADGVTRCTRVGTVEFAVRGLPAALRPVLVRGLRRRAVAAIRRCEATVASTYGGGRYLYDTIKGADLGATATDFVLDFNLAYNPSCAYDGPLVVPVAAR